MQASITRFLVLIFPVFELAAVPADSLSLVKSTPPIVFLSDCTPKEFCLLNNSCTTGWASFSVEAEGGCSTLNYSYQLDLMNNGSFDSAGNANTLSDNFPAGTHRIVWKAKDNCGLSTTCMYTFKSRDCSGPDMLIITGLTTPLQQPDCQATVKAADYFLSVSDNCTATNLIEIGIRKTGDGTGFPTTKTLTFGACQGGTNLVEIWTRDLAGNTSMSNGYALAQDNSGTCPCPKDTFRFSGSLVSPKGEPILGADIKIQLGGGPGSNPPIKTPLVFDTLTGNWHFDVIARPWSLPYTVSVIPVKYTDALNGVSTFDNVDISKHILSVKKFTTMYQMVAADVNLTNLVTTFDIVDVRKIILGINSSFPGNDSWRFIRKLANAADLAQWPNLLPNYSIDIIVQENVPTPDFPNLDFIGIKIGDVNLSADPTQ